MSRRFNAIFVAALVGGMALAADCSDVSARPQPPKKQPPPEQLVYVFQGGTDGGRPNDGLIADQSGNLYGTTTIGGVLSCINPLPRNAHYEPPGCGVVFRLAPDGTETVLYAFNGDPDGAEPNGHLISDSAGNIYGTTTYGGAQNRGTAFKIAPGGTETVLHSFSTGGDVDGDFPLGGLAMDAAGNLYGATSEGGPKLDGTVYKIAPNGTHTVLYNFMGGADGYAPTGSLVLDGSGNLYGTTEYGGPGIGTVFKIAPNGTETILYKFKGTGGIGDGEEPDGVIMDASRNLYGITRNGGSNGDGIVYKLAPNGTETVLYNFKSEADGYLPDGTVVMDATGNLFGATAFGGTATDGTVFKLAPNGTKTILTDFGAKKKNGWEPEGGLLLDQSGNLYGTAYEGATGSHGGNGLVFKLTQ